MRTNASVQGAPLPDVRLATRERNALSQYENIKDGAMIDSLCAFAQ
jgi:hypothetical protein